MRAVAGPGRWVWGLSGLVTAVALAVPGARLITLAKVPSNDQVQPQATMIRTLTVPQPVTSLTVQSYGGQVEVTAGPVSRVHVTERIMYASPGGVVPAVPESVAGGRLSLGDPACATSDCSVDFAVTVPPDVTVTVSIQGGAPVTVSGTAGADLNSDGGPVRATRISGPLTVATGGGPLTVDGLTGPLRAGTDGGTLIARGIAAATATVSTGGGPAQIAFSVAPASVTVSTDGGPALLTVPGGPYALSADSDGGPQQVGIATDPHARASLAISSGGGPLMIEP